MAKTCSPQGTGRDASPVDMPFRARRPPGESGAFSAACGQESGDLPANRLLGGCRADDCASEAIVIHRVASGGKNARPASPGIT